MPEGIVKRYERNSGFGFIETEEGDLFVHHTALKDREFLLPGQKVEYQVEASDRGPRAVGVRVMEEVSPKRKNHPDWRGHRGGAPRFEDRRGSRRDVPPGESEQRVLPGRGGTRQSPRRRDATIEVRGDVIGPPRDQGDEPDDAVETGSTDTGHET
jgi:CspA family cold shock protein